MHSFPTRRSSDLVVVGVRPLDAVQRRLRDVDVPVRDELRHVPEQQREQQRPDVLAVDVGVRHQHDLRSEEHTSELQSQFHLVCRLLLEKKNIPFYIKEPIIVEANVVEDRAGTNIIHPYYTLNTFLERLKNSAPYAAVNLIAEGA